MKRHAALLALVPAAAAAHAHQHLLIPGSPAARPGDSLRLQLLHGHPFESAFELAAVPISLRAYPPRGEPVNLLGAGADEIDARGKARVYGYTVEERGDHVIALEAAPIVEKEEDLLVIDHVKVIVHVLSDRGWDRKVGQPLEVVPLTRPYGLKPGAAFQAAVLHEGLPLAGARVEVEKYNRQPPAAIPEDEFVTAALLTGPGGVLTATLDADGWWGITASTRAGKRKGPDGVEREVLLRATFWLHVGGPLLPPAEK